MSSSSTSRYSPNDFSYNGRVAMALLPCLAAISIIGGRGVISVLALGSVAGYTMDLLQYRDGAYTCSWLTLLATSCAFSISVFATATAAVLTQYALVFAVVIVTGLCGMWTSLQFKYFQMQHPAVALAFERFVITGSLPAAAILHTMGLAFLVDASDLAYYTATVLCALYAYFGRPLASSFVNTRTAPALGGGAGAAAGGAAARKAARMASLTNGTAIQSKTDAALMALTTVVTPALLYAAIHWEVLTRHALHAHSLLLLVCGPLLFLTLLPSGLWWAPGGGHPGGKLHTVLMVIGLIGSVIGFEGRVVFHSFSQYIQLPPPWSWAAVTLALLGVAAIILAAQHGILGGSLDVTLAGSALLLCTTAGAIATGVPFHWLPAPLVAACGLALFLDSLSLREYIVFVGGAFMTGVWFVMQHFWLLNITVGGLHLHSIVRLALAALLPALMIPGLVYARVAAPALDALVMLQATLLAILEETLYVPSHSDWSGEVMYPGYLVVGTTAVGLIAARHLRSRGHITQLGSWVAHSVYGAKLAMLLIPEAQLVMPTIMCALCSSAPVFLTPMAPGSSAAARRRARIPPWMGLVQALSIFLAVGLARFAVFDIVQFLLSSRPPEGLLLGALLLALAGALAPLVYTCYSTNPFITRMLASLALGGLLLVMLQPPLPLRGGASCPRLPLALCPRLWDERHVPLHDTEDAEVWGTGLARKEYWPRWLLFAALVLGVAAGALGGNTPAAARAAARGQGSGAGAALRRLVVAAVTGVLVGSYVALEVVPSQVVLQVLVLISCCIVVAFVCLLPLPAVRGPLILPGLAMTWVVVLGFTMLLQAELPPVEPPEEMKRLYPETHLQVEQEIEAATRAALLAVAACQAALLAMALKLHVVSTLKAQDLHLTSENGHGGDEGLMFLGTAGATGNRGSDLFCGVVPLAVFSRWGSALRVGGGPCSALLNRLGGAGLSWAPSLGNMCAMGAYAMCVSLNVQITGGSAEALFLAAPLLLLMQQDPLIAPALTSARRYVIPFSATTASLLLACITSSFLLATGGTPLSVNASRYLEHQALIPLLNKELDEDVLAIMQLAVAAACVPGAVLLTWAMWASKPLKKLTQIWTAILCLVVLLLSPQPAALYCAGLVLVSSLAHHANVRHIRAAGAKII